ncbi:TcpQ domain-containing protein [Pseudomonas sp. W22_MBD1_FP4]|uniref:toxin co-regulated pilus biosynthesis Q family protein n=1 Tax=Pseudomonas sp. W22_MBD1_FP4 TaxID=3240272 RepID=UPI003F981201
MKRSLIATALLAATVASSTAFGAFYLDDGNIVSTERGQMGKFQPYDAEGRATFEAPSASMAPKQAKYKDAQLMVDLAYSAVTQRGSGEPGLVAGFGDSLPFVDAMSMILPSGWQQYRDNTLTEKEVPERISFSGGRTWPDVLKQIGERYALHWHIDWYDKTIMLSKGRPSMASQARQLRVIPEPAKPSGAAGNIAQGANKAALPSGAVVLAAPGNTSITTTHSMPASSVNAATVVVGTTPNSAALTSTTATVAVAPPKPFVPAIPTWKVGPNDKTIREALKGWTKAAGWTFEPEHWAVPVDIPITAGASFSGDFKTATRQLISTTELGATPLQPCFYSNRVVRVVPINEMCDRMSAR